MCLGGSRVKNRVTLRYKSKSGNEYLYDDCTSTIYKWNDLYESVLLLEGVSENEVYDRLKQKYEYKEIKDALEFVGYLKNDLGAFYREEGSFSKLPSKEEYLMYIGNYVANQLILSVTDDCNLRCKYCYYSDVYLSTKNKNNKKMDSDTAKRAIDYFFSLVKPQMNRNPYKKFAVTFYGGEPLTNMSVVQFAIEYINSKYPGRIRYNLTTNGLLLNSKNVKFLKENNVGISVSLDGPKEEHDRLRIRPDGSGSYDNVIKNINYIKEMYPKYFKENVSIISVYDTCTDIEKTNNFFYEGQKSGKLPKTFAVNSVANKDTVYYERFTDENYKVFNNKYNNLTKDFINSIVNNEQDISTYLKFLVGSPIIYLYIRNRMKDAKSALIPMSAACIPGHKICVDSSGNMDICEKVNGCMPIGNIDTGLDAGRILQIINDYRKNVVHSCFKCPISNLCKYCFIQFEKQDKFIDDTTDECNLLVSLMETDLSTYSTIYEENPKAQFQLQVEPGIVDLK